MIHCNTPRNNLDNLFAFFRHYFQEMAAVKAPEYHKNILDIRKMNVPMNTGAMPGTDPVALKAAQLLRDGKNEESIVFLTEQKELTPKAFEYLCDAYFQSRQWQKAYEIVSLLLANGSASLYNRKLEFKILSNWEKYKEALSSIEAFVADHGEDLEALGTAKICNYQIGNHAEAVKFGQEVMLQKDRLANEMPEKSIPIRPNRNGKKIISYSVWGENKAYLYGATINIALAKINFADWVVRIYGASSIPSEVLALYRSLGAEVILADQVYPDVPTYFWRFLVADDPEVHYFICRDADCRLRSEEADLVNTWLASKKQFHVIRDHVLHDELILAGMWGGMGSSDWNMRKLISEYFNGNISNKYSHDQIFLRKMVWKKIKQYVFVHDKTYWTPGVKSHKHPFTCNFGEGFTSEKHVLQEASKLGLI